MATTTKTTAALQAAPTNPTTAKPAAKPAEAPDPLSFANPTDWAETAKEQFETLMSSFSGNFDDIRADAENLADTTQARMKAVQDHTAKTNARLMEAAQEEMSGAVQLATDLGKAKSFADVLGVQQSYWAKLFENRMTHIREITESSVETARETMTPVKTPFTANIKTFEKFFAFPAKA